MEKQKLMTLGVPAFIAVALISAITWKTIQPPQTLPPQPPAVVSATQVMAEQREPVLHSVGSLVATNGIEVSTEVNGIVSEIVVKSGQTVQAGEILIRLDVAVDQAALDALRAERKLARVQFNRARDLLKKKVTSKSEFDEAHARFESADARVRQQEAVIERKTILAPFSGLAGIRQVDLGQYLEAGDAIISLQDLNPIHVDYTLAERYITRIKTEQTVKLTLDAIPGQTFSGTVSAINAGIDPGTRTMKVRATLDNPNGALRPGMFAQVETVIGNATQALTLPRTAISVNTYGNFVFVINEDDAGKLSVKRTAVSIGETFDGRVIVKNLDEGTRVVRTGLVKLQDGMAVSIDNQVKLDDATLTGE